MARTEFVIIKIPRARIKARTPQKIKLGDHDKSGVAPFEGGAINVQTLQAVVDGLFTGCVQRFAAQKGNRRGLPHFNWAKKQSKKRLSTSFHYCSTNNKPCAKNPHGLIVRLRPT